MKHFFLVVGLLLAVSTFGQRTLGYSSFPQGFGGGMGIYQNTYWNGNVISPWSWTSIPNQILNTAINTIHTLNWAVNGYGYAGYLPYGNGNLLLGNYSYNNPIISSSPLFINNPISNNRNQCEWILQTEYETQFFMEDGEYKRDANGNYISRLVPITKWVWVCK